MLRGLWGEQGLDEAILPILAKQPEEADRARFVAGLASAQPATVAARVGGTGEAAAARTTATRRWP